jgi:hypothetical protein
VDDEAARVFAETFYASLVRGNRFIVAVGEARREAYRQNPHVNTWAAYQCYGDPDWMFRRGPTDPNQAPVSSDDFSNIASAVGLKLALERIVVQTKYQGADATRQLDTLRKLVEKHKNGWATRGDVAELFGEAFVETGDVEAGLEWYRRAVDAADGTASLTAAEQLANVGGRLGWELVDSANRRLAASRKRADDMPRRKGRTTRASKAAAAAQGALADAGRALHDAIARAETLFDDALALLGKLNAIHKTVERESLAASVFKRRALVDLVAARRDRVRQDLAEMRRRYEAALKTGRKSPSGDIFYPLSNRLATDVAEHAGRPRWRGLDKALLAELKASLKEKDRLDQGFWSVVGQIEVKGFEALAAGKVEDALDGLEKEYEDLHRRVTATRMWASVYDTACLVLQGYADRAGRRKKGERSAALALLALLRGYAHPESAA